MRSDWRSAIIVLMLLIIISCAGFLGISRQSDHIVIEVPDVSLFGSHMIRSENVFWLNNTDLLIPLMLNEEQWGDIVWYADRAVIRVDIEAKQWSREFNYGVDMSVTDAAVDSEGEQMLFAAQVAENSLDTVKNVLIDPDQSGCKIWLPFRPPLSSAVIFLKHLDNEQTRILREENGSVFHDLSWITPSVFSYRHTGFINLYQKPTDFIETLSSIGCGLVIQDQLDFTTVDIDFHFIATAKAGSLFIWIPPGETLTVGDCAVPVVVKQIHSNLSMLEVQFRHYKPLPGHEDELFYYYKAKIDSIVVLNFRTGQRTSFLVKSGIRKYDDYAISPNDSLIAFVNDDFSNSFFGGSQPLVRVIAEDIYCSLREAVKIIYGGTD